MEELKIISPEAYQYLIETILGAGPSSDTNQSALILRMESLKMVIPSGSHELEVRKGHEAYVVNIHLKQCMCRMWQLLRIPCVHSVAAYSHMNKDPIEGVDHWVKGAMGDTGKSQRGRGKGQRGRGRGQMQRDGEEMTEDEIRKHLEHEYNEEILLEKEQKREAYQTEQDEFDQEALRYTLKGRMKKD
ncbi:zinc finger, PMZ-type containing protein [Tanacetum coccineum]